MQTDPPGNRGTILKSAREIGLMRRAGGLVCRVLDAVAEMVRPGVTTAALNARAEELIASAEAVPLFKGVVHPQARRPFPGALCTSVNDQIVHGIPGDQPLSEGDIVSVDCGVKLDGYCGDAARTFAVGTVTDQVVRLIDVTRRALDVALTEMRPGRMWSEVARRIQALVEGEKFHVVRDFVGHGIGQEMHEEPKVPNYYDRRQRQSDFRLVEGLVLAVEPMVTVGTLAVRYGDADRWAIVTRDGSYAAHFEHTVAVTASGVEVLTDGR